jgi:predicted nucleic acid-binding protein
VSKKAGGREKSIAFIRELIEILEVLSVTKKTIIDALNADFKDFEDAVQYCAAEMNCIDIIVTRNKSDFKLSAIEVCTPDELIKKLKESH